MAKGYKTGGSTAGTPNKRTQDVAEKLEALGCDPIAGMAKLATDESVEMGIRAQMYRELAQYVASKLRAVEVQAEVGYSWIDAIRNSYKYDRLYRPDPIDRESYHEDSTRSELCGGCFQVVGDSENKG